MSYPMNLEQRKRMLQPSRRDGGETEQNQPATGALSANLVQRARISPERLSSQDVLDLQRTLGNRQVSRMLAPNAPPASPSSEPSVIPLKHAPAVQATSQSRTTVAPADGSLEQQADRMAQHVTGQTAAKPVQRSTSGLTAQEIGTEGGPIPEVTEQTLRQARGSGKPLDQPVRRQMEGSFGADFGGVRIHTDARADRLNRSLQARAFTTGQDIFFSRSQYRPYNMGGKQLLAHELTHTIQQTGGSAGAPGVQRVASTRPMIQRFPRFSRFSARQSPIKWREAKDAAVSGSGQTGVMFISNKPNMKGKTVVIKATDDPPSEVLFAEQLHKSIAKVKMPKTRVVEKAERGSLGLALHRIIREKTQRGEDASRVQTYFQNNFVEGNHIYVMEKAGGEMVDTLARDDRADTLLKTFTKPSVMKRLGRLHTLDIFLGNTDRMLSNNWKNVMVKGTTITAIDNVDPNSDYRSLTDAGPHSAWQGDQDLQILSDDQAIRTEAARVVTDMKQKLAGGTADNPYYSTNAVAAGNLYLTQPKMQEMYHNFLAGMLDSRNKLFKRLGVTGKESKNMKSRTNKLATQYGGISWQHLTARAGSLQADDQ